MQQYHQILHRRHLRHHLQRTSFASASVLPAVMLRRIKQYIVGKTHLVRNTPPQVLSHKDTLHYRTWGALRAQGQLRLTSDGLLLYVSEYR